jgi:3-dehydroquinate synthetase
VRSAGLPDTLPAGIDVEDILQATRGDKKARAGQAEYALPTRIGEMNSARGRWSLTVSDVVVREILG